MLLTWRRMRGAPSSYNPRNAPWKPCMYARWNPGASYTVDASQLVNMHKRHALSTTFADQRDLDSHTPTGAERHASDGTDAKERRREQVLAGKTTNGDTRSSGTEKAVGRGMSKCRPRIHDTRAFFILLAGTESHCGWIRSSRDAIVSRVGGSRRPSPLVESRAKACFEKTQRLWHMLVLLSMAQCGGGRS
jgi:hypothetical protein